jgi:anti-sigma B factor antagonist
VLPRLAPLSSPAAAVADGGLAVSVDWTGGVIRLVGELDRETAHHLLDALEGMSSTPHRTWAVDASEVSFCDAGGLRALAAGQALAARHGRHLRVVAYGRCVERLVLLTGLDGLLDGAPPARALRPVTELATRGRRSGGVAHPSRPGRRTSLG